VRTIIALSRDLTYVCNSITKNVNKAYVFEHKRTIGKRKCPQDAHISKRLSWTGLDLERKPKNEGREKMGRFVSSRLASTKRGRCGGKIYSFDSATSSS
jgi:hypothetical protein